MGAEYYREQAKLVLARVGADWPKLEKLVAIALVDERTRALQWVAARCWPSEKIARGAVQNGLKDTYEARKVLDAQQPDRGKSL